MDQASEAVEAIPPCPDRPEGLPEYGHPPVDESAIALQFQPIQGYSRDLVSAFCQASKDEYPVFDDSQPRIEPAIESLNVQVRPPVPTMVVGGPGRERTWVVSEDDNRLLQLQDNMYVCNWRRRRSSDEYPRFEPLWNRFWVGFNRLRHLVAEQGLPPIQIRQIEVTYINWIVDLPSTQFLSVLGGTDLSGIPSLGAPEDQAWIARYLMRDAGNAFGRLLVSCQPALRADEFFPGAGYQFSLTARVPLTPAARSDDELSKLIFQSRVTIVEAFTKLTGESAQESWGIQHDAS
jgi:uncharacterized protein (TIGR04255 family)